MDGFSGVLLIPPDRGHILSRPVWKTRFVVIGKRVPISLKKDREGSVAAAAAASTPVGGLSNSHSDLKPLAKVMTDEYCISVFKHKGDPEPVHQWPTSCVADCQVEMVSYRRQEPALPTLVVTLSDKERKRRSTRSAGLISNKDSGASTLWFRAPPDDPQPTLQQWAQCILSRKQPMSSDGPATSLFSASFTPRSRDAADYQHGTPGAGNYHRHDMRSLQHKSSNATYSTGRDRPATFSSDSPSVRSRRSDVSSPSSLNQYIGQTYTIGGQHYITIPAPDAGSNGAADGMPRGGAIEGWAAARGRNSPVDPLDQEMYDDVSAPPAPGETILDRAFQLGHVPGAGANVPGQEKFSSIARFDNLMRELDEKRKQKEQMEAAAAAEAAPPRGPGGGGEGEAGQSQEQKASEADDSSDGGESRDPEEPEYSDSEYDDDLDAEEQGGDFYGRSPLISPSARRALDFIAGRNDEGGPNARSPRPTMSRNHQSFHNDSQPRPRSPARPHTSHGKSRPQSQRAQSVAYFPSTAAGPLSAVPAVLLVGRKSDNGTKHHPLPGEKRQSGPSSSSSKRLSFSEFTRRLSSTSGLLLHQTNAGGGSSRGSSETDAPAPTSLTTRSNTLNVIVGSPGPDPPARQRQYREEREAKKCGWRGSVGVIDEGQFM